MDRATPHRIGVYLAVVQFLFTLTWTVYVIFLPKLAAQAGIPKQWVVYILLADQLVFVVMDFAMGIAADRVSRVLGKLGYADPRRDHRLVRRVPAAAVRGAARRGVALPRAHVLWAVTLVGAARAAARADRQVRRRSLRCRGSPRCRSSVSVSPARSRRISRSRCATSIRACLSSRRASRSRSRRSASSGPSASSRRGDLRGAAGRAP